MKRNIVRRQFAKVGGAWVELDDMRRRGVEVEQSWSSFCALVRADKPEEAAPVLRKQVAASQIDFVPSTAARGVWVVGAYYQLEKILAGLAVN